MKYIEKIIIENFQSHKHTILNFEKGVNVIIGPSDSGKTSIIRAIRWVMYNEPSGDYFIRKGETEASVTLYLDNGYIIKRGRSKNKNYYEITDDSNKVEHYEGFGTNVPLEIQEALGVRKVKLSENYNLALNISEQLESPFLLNETPSIKSNAIGRLAGTDVIDNALQKLSKDMYSLKTRLKYDKEDLDKLNEEIKKYKNLDEEKRKIDNFKNIINSLKQKKTLLQNLKKLKEEYNFVELNINKNQEIFENYKDIEIFEKNINIISDKLMKLKYIIELNDKLNNINTILEKHIKILQTSDKLDIIEYNLNKSQFLFEKYINFKKILKQYNDINKKINYNEKILELSNIEQLDYLYEKSTELKNKYIILKEINNKKKFLDNKLDNGFKYIEKFNTFNQASKHINLLEINSQRLNSLYKISTQLDKLNIQINNLKTQMVMNDKRTELMVNEYINLLKQYLICPICKHKIDKNHIDKIIAEYRGE